jgi:YD repeat-containing protein
LVFESGSKKMNFNAAKRVDPLAGVDGNAMTFTGDSDDLSSVRNSLVSTLTVTPTDKVATITYPSTYPNASVTFNYNNLDNLTSIVDSVGTTYFNSYDDAGRLLSMTNSYGFAIAYQYDAAGNVTQITYPGTNKTVSYTYDALNRMSTVTINWLQLQCDHRPSDEHHAVQRNNG